MPLPKTEKIRSDRVQSLDDSKEASERQEAAIQACQKEAVKLTEEPPDPVFTTTYSPAPSRPDGPRLCDQVDFRLFDPYCPQIYKCQDYDSTATWFDGNNEKDTRFTIDLEEGSMDKLPDIRPYLYYMGYWGHWEIEGATTPIGLDGLDRAQTEEFYVNLGRAYLMRERAKGHGFFLAKRDWSRLMYHNYGPLPWVEFWRKEDGQKGDVGMEDLHEDGVLDEVAIGVVKTNIRATMSYARLVKVRPGHADWDKYIQWLYLRRIHGLGEITLVHASIGDVFRRRYEDDYEHQFMFEQVDDESDQW